MQSTLRRFQDLQLKLKNNILNLSFPALGPKFQNLGFEDTQDALIAYRLTKKLSKVDSSSTRARDSVLAMLEYDENGLTHFQPGNDSSCDPFIKWMIYRIRPKFHKCLENFKLDYTNFNFPSGESLISRSGDVSLYSKLRDKDQWCVTRDCRDYFIKLVYSNLWFKRSAMHHIRRHPFYVKHKRTIDRYLWNKYGGSSSSAYDIFRVKMIEFVLTIVPGARLATVPKDNVKDRVIEIESFGNMCVQRCIANSFIKVISNHFGYDLRATQQIHGQLISDHGNATIDFSNASNSNWTSLLEFYFPPRVVRLLKETRSQVVSYEGQYYPLNMIAPMGNGFTFEVMSLFLLTIAREFDSLATVFGDDVILDSDTAPSFLAFMAYHGWQVNETKSFISGNFRESCGYFHHTLGYLTSYDFWLAEDEVDIMICTNKILFLLDHVTDIKLHTLLQDFWNEAIKLNSVRSYRDKSLSYAFISESYDVHHLNKDLCNTFDMPYLKRCVYLRMAPRKEPILDRGCVLTRNRYKSLTKILTVNERLSYKQRKNRFLSTAKKLSYSSFDICVYPVKDKADHLHRAPLRGVRNKFWLSTYFRFGRVVQPKSGKDIIKYKTLMITGTDIEL